MTDLTQRARDVAGRLKRREIRGEGMVIAWLPPSSEAIAEAAAIISELVERIEGLEARDNTQAFMADLLVHGTAMRDSTGRHIPIHDFRLTDAEIEAKRVLGKQEEEG